jgi:hypothetical protein
MNERIRDFSDVILSGGTGRSGTTIVGKLLSRHSKIGLSRPSEIKMLTSGNGLLDLHLGRRVGWLKRLLVTDRLHLERFHYRLNNDWWERDSKVGEIAGLIQGIEAEELSELYRGLTRNWKEDRKAAPREFFRSFVDSQKRVSGKDMWIETTPVNLFRARELSEFLPGVRFIHMVRDGRDVIASVVREHWGPKTYEEGLTWYRRRMRRNLINANFLSDKVFTISLEDLVIHKREDSLRKILQFLNLESEDNLENYFSKEVVPDKVKRGRWRTEVQNLEEFNKSYFEIVTELKAIDSKVPLESW